MEYVANPVEVDAERIVEIVSPATSDHPMILKLDNGKLWSPNAGMLARMVPVVGDYVVTQSDGYVYLNPKEIFERKYRPLNVSRPTIEELEKILNSEENQDIVINADGSITTVDKGARQ